LSERATNGRATAPLVSVVIPTLGRPGLLDEAVRSVMAQDYGGPIECVVVLDDPAAAPPALPPDTPLRTARVVRNRRGQGPAGGRNTGVLDAAGEFVAFLDDDDSWLPAKLGLQVEALAASGARAAGSSIVIRSGGSSHPRRFGGSQLTFDHLRRGRQQTVHQSTIVASRAYFTDDVGLFDEAIPYHYGEDLDWLLRATTIEPVEVVDRPLVTVRWHEASFFSTRWDAIATALPYLLEKHPALESDRRYVAALSGRVAFAHAVLGRRREAWSWLSRAARARPIEPRVALAAAALVSPRLASPLFRAVRRTGRSI
jgi:glycosyltransferase involved in cell wall biosynthesis